MQSDWKIEADVEATVSARRPAHSGRRPPRLGPGQRSMGAADLRKSRSAAKFEESLTLKRGAISQGVASTKLPSTIGSIDELLGRSEAMKRKALGLPEPKKKNTWGHLRLKVKAQNLMVKPNVHTHKIGDEVKDTDTKKWSESLRLRRHPQSVSSVVNQAQFRESMRQLKERGKERIAEHGRKMDKFRGDYVGPGGGARRPCFLSDFQMMAEEPQEIDVVPVARGPKTERPSTAPRLGRKAFVEARHPGDSNSPSLSRRILGDANKVERPTSAPPGAARREPLGPPPEPKPSVVASEPSASSSSGARLDASHYFGASGKAAFYELYKSMARQTALVDDVSKNVDAEAMEKQRAPGHATGSRADFPGE